MANEEEGDNMNLLPLPDECTYTKCYCEENVWMLCDYVRKNSPGNLHRCYCVFISNEEKAIPLWCQKSSTREDTMVCWDYHVIFIYGSPNQKTLVCDLDTTLSFPCDFKTYVGQGIRSNSILMPKFYRQFRVIKAEEFLSSFSSDRSHMLSEDGSWMSPPPEYPCIQVEGIPSNIKEFWSMDPNIKHGKVLTFEEFVNYFYHYDGDKK